MAVSKFTKQNQLDLLFSIFAEVEIEVDRIIDKHGLFNSAHELLGVLLEEGSEFMASVHANNPDTKELVQIAAVAIAGVLSLRTKSTQTPKS